jgi:type III secretory pathway component EscT
MSLFLTVTSGWFFTTFLILDRKKILYSFFINVYSYLLQGHQDVISVPYSSKVILTLKSFLHMMEAYWKRFNIILTQLQNHYLYALTKTPFSLILIFV